MNQLVVTRFVSVPENEAFFIIVHVKVFVKLLAGAENVRFDNKYFLTSTSTSQYQVQQNCTLSYLIQFRNAQPSTSYATRFFRNDSTSLYWSTVEMLNCISHCVILMCESIALRTGLLCRR